MIQFNKNSLHLPSLVDKNEGQKLSQMDYSGSYYSCGRNNLYSLREIVAQM